MMAAMNNMAKNCFQSCVYNFRSTVPDEKEQTCLENCVGKHVEASQKLIENFTKVQEYFQQKTADHQDQKQREYIEKVILNHYQKV